MSRLRRVDGAAWIALTALLCLGAIVVTAIGAESGTPLTAAPLLNALDWEPALALGEPWRLWTSVWVHWSGAHLGVNLAGAAVVGFLGWRARAGVATTLAWFVAWPLTQLAMAAGGVALFAAMPHYGGLSGVLHAGVIVLGLALAWPRAAARMHGLVARLDTGFVATRASTIEPSRITEGPWAMTGLDESAAPTALPVSTLEAARPRVPVDGGSAARDRWIGTALVAGTVIKVLFEQPWNLALRPSIELGISVAPIAHACGVAAGLVGWGLVRLAGWRGRRAG
ncbi:MAG: hypothetical protein ABJD97_09300 [Betaproteobacteria bacterium]